MEKTMFIPKLWLVIITVLLVMIITLNIYLLTRSIPIAPIKVIGDAVGISDEVDIPDEEEVLVTSPMPVTPSDASKSPTRPNFSGSEKPVQETFSASKSPTRPNFSGSGLQYSDAEIRELILKRIEGRNKLDT